MTANFADHERKEVPAPTAETARKTEYPCGFDETFDENETTLSSPESAHATRGNRYKTNGMQDVAWNTVFINFRKQSLSFITLTRRIFFCQNIPLVEICNSESKLCIYIMPSTRILHTFVTLIAGSRNHLPILALAKPLAMIVPTI